MPRQVGVAPQHIAAGETRDPYCVNSRRMVWSCALKGFCVRLTAVIWKSRFRDKIMYKHQVGSGEVEEVVFGKPFVVRIARGKIRDEHVYAADGQTHAGRHLVVFFINKGVAVLPISARAMTDAERKYYREKGK